MKCPACSNELSPYTVEGITLDVCEKHCGGIWFDAGELDRFDEATESAPASLLRVVRNANVAIDYNRARECPKCAGEKLKKRMHDAERGMQIDQCMSCYGVWLDPGELETLREENRGAVERQRTIDDFYASMSAPGQDDSQPANKGLRAVLRLIFK